MTIQDMHKLFRTTAQQAGMEAVRAILPDEIDRILNQSINAFVRNILYKNSLIPYKERLTLMSNNVSPINALRSLYKVVKQDRVSVETDVDESKVYTFDFNSEDLMIVVNVAVVYNKRTLPYDCRYIEPEEYHRIRRDFCNSPSYDYPIISMIEDTKSVITFRFENDSVKHKPLAFEIGYIKEPNIVSFDKGIDCDLPDHTHFEIVTNAVKVYLAAINLTTNNVQ